MSRINYIFLLGILCGALIMVINYTQKDDEDLANSEESKMHAQQYVKPILLKNLNEVFGTMEEFNTLGGVYLNDEGKYVIAIKENNKLINDLNEKLANTSIQEDVKILSVEYSTQELIQLRDNLWEYMFENELEMYVISIGANIEKQKATLLINSLPKKDMKKLNKEFPGMLEFELTEDIVVPQGGLDTDLDK